MRAYPKEFSYTYVKLAFDDVDSKVLETIKDKIKRRRDTDYVDYDGDELVVFMKESNPVDVFKKESEGLCDFWSGFTNVRNVGWILEKKPSNFWYKRYEQYTGKTEISRYIRKYETE